MGEVSSQHLPPTEPHRAPHVDQGGGGVKEKYTDKPFLEWKKMGVQLKRELETIYANSNRTRQESTRMIEAELEQEKVTKHMQAYWKELEEAEELDTLKLQITRIASINDPDKANLAIINLTDRVEDHTNKETGYTKGAKLAWLEDQLVSIEENIAQATQTGHARQPGQPVNNDIFENGGFRRLSPQELAGMSSQELLAYQTQLQNQQLMEQREYNRLVTMGYDSFVEGAGERLLMSPESFLQQKPVWRRRLTEREKNIVDTSVNINFIAAVVRYEGMENLESCLRIKGAEIDKYKFNNMLTDMPGFRQAIATMVDDLFETRRVEVTKHGNRIDRREVDGSPTHLVLSEEGVRIVGDQQEFSNYKKKLQKAITKHLRDNENNLTNTWGVDDINTIASAAVITADNLFYGTGVYNSADEGRQVVNDWAWAEQPRSFQQPGDKGVDKWLGRDVFESLLPEGTDEGWGGKTGEWMRERCHNDGDFAKAVQKRDIRYVPDRLIGSMFDHSWYDGGVNADKSLSQALLSADKVTLNEADLEAGTIELKDFEGGVQQLDMTRLKGRDLWGSYANLADSVKKLYENLLGKDPAKKLNMNDFMSALYKASSDNWVGGVYRDWQFLDMSLVNMISPDGLTYGTNELVLNITDDKYEGRVHEVMGADERIFEFAGPGYKKHFYDAIYTVPQNEVTAVTGAAAFLSRTLFMNPESSVLGVAVGRRAQERRSAERSVAKKLRRH